ncbi:YciI family protein [Muricoccus nepalensis]|nr:YciI family protein [Roseomonas nepalensis]
MTDCTLVLAKGAADAAERIGAVRPAHLDLLASLAEAGDLLLGVAVMDEAGAYRGSLLLVADAALDRYLEAEPFRRGGVWESHATHPFRLASLPWRPLPSSGPAAPSPTHSIAIARDGADPEALSRRLAVRDAHFARVHPAAETGLLAAGGAILDAPGGRMVGSVAITAHPSLDEARAWWAVDPYMTGGVWRDTAWHLTRFAPLPYRPLPGP